MMNKIAEIVTNWENAKGIIRVGVRKPAEENTNDLFLGEYMGMETFFYIPVEVNGQRGNVKVTYPMFENYGVTSSEMLAVAINNNAKAGFTIRSMAEVMAELMGVDDAPESEAPLYIVLQTVFQLHQYQALHSHSCQQYSSNNHHPQF